MGRTVAGNDVELKGNTVDADEFTAWLTRGKSKTCIYLTAPPGKHVKDDAKVMAAAFTAAVNRKVYLYQRRQGETFEYIAEKPADGAVPERMAPAPMLDNKDQKPSRGRLDEYRKR